MQQAKVIVRYGIGVDNVDLKAAQAKGIPVCNVPDYCVDEVADHTLAFILATTRQVVPNALHLRAGGWGLATPLDQLKTMRDQVCGVVGFGRIGREVAARLLPFKSRVDSRCGLRARVARYAAHGGGYHYAALPFKRAHATVAQRH